ncbi:RHS repeat-associated core domain-containing protein [Treponema denticola]|uniref:hypothetical protein n=1 Tax=Treponema denticola TaxID=158 RepID=UPI0021C25953|nr:hypothetical protein [Treponema denticola]
MQQADRRSFEASAVPILVCFYILCNNKSYKEPSGFLRAEPLSSSFEDRRGCRGGKELLSDKSVFPSLTTAPIDDEAKKHNENLPGMGGVFNTVNLHVYHYAGNNPVKYTDPDGRLLINNVSENSASAREYERNHNLRYIAFLIKTLDAKGNAQIPIGNIDIILEKGLNKSLTLANAVKNNPNYVVDVKAIASETKNGNYQIDIDVLVFHYGADGKLVCDVNNSGTIAFADSSELGVFGPNSSIDQKLVNQKANEVINTVLHISNANLVGDK